MAEINSIQMAKVLESPTAKLEPNERHGRKRIMFAQIASVAAAINDTIYFGRIPKGARLSAQSLNCAAGTAASTINLGLRRTDTGAVIDATGLGTAQAISAAGKFDTTSTGTLTKNGLSYITPTEVDVYGTIAGAATPASPGQLMSLTVDYVVD